MQKEQMSYTCLPVVSEESGTHNLNVFKGLCIFAKKKKILDTTVPNREILVLIADSELCGFSCII